MFAYFSLITITTVGYGDFDPVGVFGRAAAAWENAVAMNDALAVTKRLPRARPEDVGIDAARPAVIAAVRPLDDGQGYGTKSRGSCGGSHRPNGLFPAVK